LNFLKALTGVSVLSVWQQILKNLLIFGLFNTFRICKDEEMKSIFLSIFILVFSSCGKNSSSDSNRERSQDAITQNEYMEILNSHRQRLGLRPLIYTLIIEPVAHEHSDDMARGKTSFGHSGWRARCRKITDELRGNACSEIVAMGQKTPQAVFDAWYNSSSHRASLENPRYTHTGLGVVKNSKGVIYWTQLFLEVQ
jgi:uncharacterized protein YkwD